MPHPISDPHTLSDLLQRCSATCSRAEDLVPRLGDAAGRFLIENLGDAVRQLELILRVIEDQAKKPEKRKEEAKGLLRRFFTKGVAQPDEDQFVAPTFDVSRQGLQGNSWSVSLAELLSFLAFGRKTGVLWVDTPNENFLLGITDGVLMHGSSDCTPEGLRLGEILVGFGCLTRRQLDRFIQLQEGQQGSTGEALLESGMITMEELHQALVHQTQQLVYRMVHTTDAIFRFREGFQIDHAHQVRLDITQLLLSSAQHRDETVNPEVRSRAMEQDWNSWTENLSNKITSQSAQAEQETAPAPVAHESAAPEPAATVESADDAEALQAEAEESTQTSAEAETGHDTETSEAHGRDGEETGEDDDQVGPPSSGRNASKESRRKAG
ncbi:MAG: DUF4388 domain-containing protein [Planctomycetota bacterium]